MKKVFFLFLTVFNLSVFSQTQLYIPDTLVGPNVSLTMHKDSVQFFPTGNYSHTYAYNLNKYLGPTLIFNKGDNVNITVNNQIDDTSTVHWHGIHLPAKWDGGPHTPMIPGATWNPQFTVMDNAATYWYHPHMHMKTALQAIKGAAGLIIVRDPIEAALTLPRKYGVDDFPLIVQCQQYDSANQAMELGMQDSTLLINGARANYGYSVYGNFPAQVVRMRILNASGERAFNFGFSGNKQFYQIASDGGLLNTPYLTTRVRLAPGERAEILLDLNGMNGQTIYFMSYASELAMGIQGGPTMPMPQGSPPMDSPLNGIDFNTMQINVVPQTINPVTTIPTTLTTNSPYNPASANVTRTIRFTADSLMVMDGPFYFNDSTFDMMRIDYTIPLNSIEVWKLVNETMVAHPFHIHDVQFYVIERSGTAPGPEEMGRKDVVFVPPFDSVMFITKFEDFADTVIPFMFHCHILMHEDDGMMGQFIVSPDAVGIFENSKTPGDFTVYPNPATDQISFLFPGSPSKGKPKIIITDFCGKEMYSGLVSEKQEIKTTSWARGIYFVELISEQQKVFKKLIIN
ncbi:MAG: multicopper oxidase domain-containing protein [Bacteroidia bacterium]|nr:multicopper oxidase domain-containing protein [Bacteroidia bacterium]